MTVNVRHLLVHVRRPAHKRVLYQGLVRWLVQVVGDGALTQNTRLAGLLVDKVVWIHQLTGLRVVNVKLTTHEHIVHFRNVRVEGLVRKHCYGKYQTLGLVVNLPRTLIAELAADEAAVAFPPVFVHLLTESKRTRRQCMTVLFTKGFNGLRHLAPVVLAAKQLLGCCRTLVQADAAVQHTGIHHILTYLLRWQV